MIKNYFKIAIRNLWKNKSHSFLNIFGLAIGIACAGLIFLWTEDEINYDEVHEKKANIHAVEINMNDNGNLFTMGSTPRMLGAALKKEVPGIVNTCRLSEENLQYLFSFGEKSLYASGKYTDAAIFSMFTLPFVQGDPKKVFAQLHSIVITENTAKKFFGEEKNVVGKTVRIDNKQDFVVTGVLKDLPSNSSLQFEWLVPYENDPSYTGSLTWGSYGPLTFAEIDPQTDIAKINSKIKDFIRRKDAGQKSELFLFPMSQWRLHSEFANGKPTGGGAIKQVRMLTLIAWIILFIACINFMNLATASSQKRSKEVGVRKVMGAAKGGLISQFLIEALLMSLMATVAAIILISITLPAFNVLMQKQLAMHLGNPVHIIALLLITIICGLVAGSYPSFYLSSFKPAFVLKGIKLKTGNAAFIRRGLVVFQFTVSVVFIISTTIVYMQIQHVKNRELGFNKNDLVEIDMQHDMAAIFPVIKNDLLQTGLVQNAALSDHTTIYGGNSDERFKWEGKAEDNNISITFRNVSPEFISTSGMKVIAGRDFSPGEASKNSSVIITRSFEKMISDESAVGKIIQSARGNEDESYSNLIVVGVVEDYVYGNMYGKPGPVLFFCRPPEDANLVYVRLKSHRNATQVLATIEAVMKKNNPSYPLQYSFVDDQFRSMFYNEIMVSRVSGIFAILAVIISCLGLFGLAAYTAEQRTKEIGIRKVLGAGVAAITRLLSKDFLKLVVVSCIVAFPVAWWMMSNWLQNYEYRIGVNPLIFIASGVGALLIALLTVSFQSIKAAIANPVKSLRTE